MSQPHEAHMHGQDAASRPQKSHPQHGERLGEWRALWAMEDGQPAWLGDAVATLDGAIQGEMGHT